MMKPTLHLNGTSANSLYEGYIEAWKAIHAAIDHLAAAAPHGRDYYPQGPDAYDEARKEHNKRMNALQSMSEDMMNLAQHCAGVKF